MATKIYIGLAALFLIHGLYFLRAWLRRGRWRYLCLVGTFATLTTIYGLKSWGAIGPCAVALNPEMALRAAAVGFSVAAVVGYVQDRKAGS